MKKSLLFLFLLGQLVFSQSTTKTNNSNYNIPDATSNSDIGTQYSSVTFSNLPNNASITNVSYKVGFYHTYHDDLAARISTNYNGTSNPTDIVFKADSQGRYSGSFSKQGSTSVFNGMNPNQKFYLRVWDTSVQDTGYIDYFQVTINYTVPSPSVFSVTPSSAILGKSTTFTIRGTNLNNDMVYWIDNFGSGTVSSSSSTTTKYFTTTPTSSTGSKRGEIKDKSGGSILKNFDVDVTFPSPSSLSVNAVSSSQINISWNPVSNVYRYRLFRATSSNGSYTQIAYTSNTSYNNTGLSSNTRYYYKVKACQSSSSNSCSEYSAYKSATTNASNTPPNKPHINPFISGTVIRVGTPITFVVRSGTDNDGDKTNLHFSAKNSNVTGTTKFTSNLATGGTSYQIPVTFNQVGNHEVFATSYDEHGEGSGSVSKTITVLEAENTPPNKPHINPFVSGTVVRVGTPITFVVRSGTDNDGDKTNLHFSAKNSNVTGATKFTSSLATGGISYQIPVTFNQVGNHEVFATSYDEHGEGSGSVNKTITVVEAENTPPNKPHINPFISGTVVRVGTPITFVVRSGTDDDGDKTNLHFSAKNSNVIDATKFKSNLAAGGTSYQIPVTFNQAGNQEVFAASYDEHGDGSGSVSKVITVLEAENTTCVFSDVSSSDWFSDATQYLCTNAIIDDNTKNDGKTRPTEELNRAELAKLAYLGIGLNSSNSYADNYPSPFIDLQSKTNTWYYSYAKNLSYLEFDDHTAPFDRNYFNFRPSAGISRAHALKVLLEAFNIDETDNSGNNPYSDVVNTGEQYDVNYIIKARDLGIIKYDSYSPNFEPNEDILRAEAFVMLYNMLSVLNLSPPNINASDFYKAGNYTPKNFNNYAAMHSGNFKHYPETSFSIPSIGIPLVFTHTYNSYLSDMPEVLTPIQPLGKMWSHSFNGYLQEIDGDEARPDDFRVVFTLPNGGFQTYKKSGNGYKPETEGIYDELVKISSTKFTLTTKAQIVHTFEKLNGTNPEFPYVLTSIKDRNNNTLRIDYENANKSGFKRINEVIGTAGRKLKFNYHTQSDLITKVEDPLGRDIHFTYTSDGYLKRYTNPKNGYTSYTYGTGLQKEMLMTITLPKGNVITNTYLKKKLSSTKTNGNNPSNYSYDSGYTTTVTSPEGIITNNKYDDLGNLINLKQGSTEVKIVYDSNHKNLIKSITYNGQETSFSYDSKANLTQKNLPLGIIEYYDYNAKNDLIKYTDANGFEYKYGHNSTGNLTSFQTPRGTTTFTVNSKGLVTQVTNPENISVEFAHDSYGNVIQTNAPDGIIAKQTFDGASRLKSITNPNGHTISYTLDANDNLLEEAFNGQSTKYNVDANDNITKIINAKNNATTLTLDADDDTLREVQFGSAIDKYSYYDDGLIKTYTNPKGIVFSYVYDDELRVKSVSGGGKSINYSYDSKGRVEFISNENGAISFIYDDLDRIIQTTDYFEQIVKYEYDKNSNVTKITYPKNKVVTYAYYDDNLLKSVTDWNNQTNLYTYRKDGLLNQTTYANGTVCTLSYDGAGRMNGKVWKKSDGTIINGYEFELDKQGNHLKEVKTEPFGVIAFDTQTTTNTFNNENHITSDGTNTFGFDKNGNNTSNGNTTFEYDIYDRLNSVNATGFNASYKYDALNNRREKTVNGVTQRFVLDILGLSKVLLETDNNNNPQNYYIYGLGLVSRIDANNNTHYYHDDFRGSIIALTDENETITHKYQYTDFGDITQIEEANYNPYRYVGKHGIQFEQNGLYFMRARYYDAFRGRFLTEDPIWATNLYPYAGNNAVMNIDPEGTTSLFIESFKDNATTRAGDEAAQWYADRYIASDTWEAKALYGIGGLFASLWTPDTALETTFTLGTALIGTGASSSGTSGLTTGVSSSGNGIKMFTSSNLGVSSKLFGNSATGVKGVFNHSGSLLKAGWSTYKNKIGQYGYKFRIGLGRNSVNPNMGEYHIYLPKSFVPQNTGNYIIQVKRNIMNIIK